MLRLSLICAALVGAVQGLRVPQPTPYLAGKTADDFLHGANFAVGGATALDPEFLKSTDIVSLVPVSLSNETSWFGNVLQLLGSSAYGKYGTKLLIHVYTNSYFLKSTVCYHMLYS